MDTPIPELQLQTVEIEPQELKHQDPKPSAKPKRAPRLNSAIDHARDITVRALRSKGLSQRETAETLGIARATVALIEARARARDDGYPAPRTVERDALALKVLDRCMSVGAQMPAKKVRAADAVQAVKTYAGIAWPQLQAPTGASVSFTEIHIHEARILVGQAATTTPCVELSQDTTLADEIQPFQALEPANSVG